MFLGYLGWYHRYRRNFLVGPCCMWVDCVLQFVLFLLALARLWCVLKVVCLFLCVGWGVINLYIILFRAFLSISLHERSSFFHPASYAFYYRIFIETNRSIIIRSLSTNIKLFPILARCESGLQISIWRNSEVWIQKMFLLLWFRILSKFLLLFQFVFPLSLSIRLRK